MKKLIHSLGYLTLISDRVAQYDGQLSLNAVHFFGLPLLIIILPLLHTYLSLPSVVRGSKPSHSWSFS
jgi:hypothetical protein